MRKRDLHILTVNTFAYSGNERFGVVHLELSDERNFMIEFVQWIT